jgi:hypothetical protein
VTVETASNISQLNATLPAAGDPKSEGDDHIRLIKAAILATFPNINAVVNASDEDINKLFGLTATQAELNALHLSGATSASLFRLCASTCTTSEMNSLSGSTATASDFQKLHLIGASAADLAAFTVTTGTLGTNWSASPTIGVSNIRRGVDGFCWWTFDIFAATGAAGNSASYMTLPAGFRPVVDMLVNVGGAAGGGTTRGVITVKITAATGVVSFFDGQITPGPSANDRLWGTIGFQSR